MFAAAVVAVALLGACGGGSNGDDAPAASDDPGAAHVHGLGVDPGDGILYAATHHGVFKIPTAGTAVRIADRFQDTMGFTIAEAGRFLASGHPDMQDEELRAPGKPPLLGLIESRDGAQTWVSLSLLGDVDFHALVAAHGRVYGADATGGRFMVSADGRQWETRSQQPLLSFAVSLQSPEVVVASTGEGVLASSDGGRTWSPQAGAPGVAWLAWGPSGLWGVTASGELYRSADGATWTTAGPVPGDEPEALLADGDDIYVATSNGIHQSADGGRTWRLRYRERATTG
mgnify:CR=1 FL=1